MSTNLTVNYSGVVLTHHYPTHVPYAWRDNGGSLLYQTFVLPANYGRGTTTQETIIPDLSGFQILVDIVDPQDSNAASLSFTLDWLNQAGTWERLTEGTTTGAHTAGMHVWFDAMFVRSVPVTPAMLNSALRIGITLPPGSSIESFMYTSPSFLPDLNDTIGQLYLADGTTPFLAPGITASLNFRVLALVADSGVSFLGNDYRSAVIQAAPDNVDTLLPGTPVPSTFGGSGTFGVSGKFGNANLIAGSGSVATTYWMSPPLPSRFAVQNLFFDVRTEDDPVVIDSILVDPITPNMSFNVYYSSDDSTDITTEEGWESKLWTRVPQVYTATQRQEYVFPAPIAAKYIQLEFTNLQAKPYTPGPFQLPVKYKKFPTWVAGFFIALLEAPSFVVDQVNVVYDALNFAYNYFLDDLHQAPAGPTVASQDLLDQLTTYFNTTPTGVDATTLAQINLAMKQFAQGNSLKVDHTSLLGSYAQSLVTTTTPPTENTTLPIQTYSTVSSLNRDQVVFEQLLPVMYFFLTCRHSYKELYTTFDQNRAYFAGVNEVAFFRNDYTIQDDTPMYIESAGDLLNIDTLDFATADGVWLTY